MIGVQKPSIAGLTNLSHDIQVRLPKLLTDIDAFLHLRMPSGLFIMKVFFKAFSESASP
jgi:hypothetical protein